jgi:hypothetical protein
MIISPAIVLSLSVVFVALTPPTPSARDYRVTSYQEDLAERANLHDQETRNKFMYAQAQETGQQRPANPSAPRQDAVNRLRLLGFSVIPPPDENWHRNAAPQKGIQIMFSALKNADNGADRIRSFVIMAHTQFVEVPYEDQRQLRAYLRDSLRTEVHPDSLKSVEVSDTADANSSRPSGPAICVQYRRTTLDRGRLAGQEGQVLVIETRGKRCLHPYHPAYLVDISYGQRSANGQWDESFDTEADQVINSLTFEPMWLSGYVATQFTEYASLLFSIGRSTDASNIREYASRLQKPSTDPSSYLGFNPQKVLRDYAQLLEARSNHVKARRMETLAQRWMLNNVASYCIASGKCKEGAW